MKPNDNCIAIYTAKSVDTILREGKIGPFRLDPDKLVNIEYVVFFQNQNGKRNFDEICAPHGSIFLIAKISGLIFGKRIAIELEKFAKVKMPGNKSMRWKNPIRYGQLTDFYPGELTFTFIKPSKLKAQLPEGLCKPETSPEFKGQTGQTETKPISIPETKRQLAQQLGISEENITILIRS